MLGAVIYHVKKYLLADAFIAAAIRKSALKYAVYIFIRLEGLNAQIDPMVDRVGRTFKLLTLGKSSGERSLSVGVTP